MLPLGFKADMHLLLYQTDAYVDIVPALPPTDFAKSQGDDRPHPFVFSVNSAGLNAVLFSCETEADRNE